ncbi:MAG: hypothetical protein FWC32_06265 [Firmicutes bacterium]|nr:hypothetical protein [Bacillota bacterium]
MSEAIRKPNKTMPESHSPDMPKFLNMMEQAQSKNTEQKEEQADKINVVLPTKNSFDFKTQYSNLSNMSFVNCFAAAYVYLEGIAVEVPMKCGDGMCFGCGCGKETQSLYACLFYTMCGNSAVQRHFDEVPTKMAELIGYKGGWNGNCYTDYTVDFLFGFAGYDYRKITNADMFKHEITVSINLGRPVIAELTNGEFRVITGYDNDTLIADYVVNGQRLNKPSMPAPSYDELKTLYIIGDKITLRYTIKDGLERIKQVMENNIEEKIWDKAIEAITKAFISSTDDGYGQMNADELKMLQSRIHGTIENYHNRHTFSVAFTSWWQRLVADEQKLHQHHVSVKVLEELRDLWRLMDVYSDRIRNYTHSVGRYAYHIGSFRAAYGRMFVTILEDIQNIHTEMLALINQAIEVLDNPTV